MRCTVLAAIDEPPAGLRHFDLRRPSVMKSVPSAVADGCSDCRLANAEFLLMSSVGPIANRLSKIGNIGTHPLPRTVLTSLPLRGFYSNCITGWTTNH